MQMQTAKAICSYSFKLIFPPTSRIENMVTSSSHYIVANALMVAIIGRHGRTVSKKRFGNFASLQRLRSSCNFSQIFNPFFLERTTSTTMKAKEYNTHTMMGGFNIAIFYQHLIFCAASGCLKISLRRLRP